MPTTLLQRSTMNDGKGVVDETRAYQLARELSMLGMNGQNLSHQNGDSDYTLPIPQVEFDDKISNGHINIDSGDYLPHDINHLVNGMSLSENNGMFGNANGCRKSANMTETVPVPSSEHVAEIVGRQGCKIKALRAKTNTYIKTPVRGEEPVFVVTGRKEDVARAKHEILSAAEHFSQIRASRRTAAGSQTNGSGNCSPISVPGHVTIQVRVPYKVVGLVVGPKGATIKRIQQATSTYIVTPGRDKEPVFEVTGLPDSVEKAREEIEKHIASRTGTDNNSDLQIDDFNINGIDSGFHDQTSSDSAGGTNSDTYTSFSSKSSLNGGGVHQGDNHISVITNPPSHYSSQHQVMGGGGSNSNGTGMPGHCNCCSGSCHTGHVKSSHTQHRHNNIDEIHSSIGVNADYMKYNSTFNHYNQVVMNCSGSGGGNDQFDIDEGIGASGGSIFDPSAAAIWSSDNSSFGIQRSNSIGVSSARILPPGEDCPHPRTRRTNSDPLAAAFQAAFTTSSRSSSQASMSPVTGRRNNEHIPAASSTAHGKPTPGNAISRQCMVCGGCMENVGMAALVPCRHNSFCVKCAGEICQRAATRSSGGVCPVCQEPPTQAVRLHN